MFSRHHRQDVRGFNRSKIAAASSLPQTVRCNPKAGCSVRTGTDTMHSPPQSE